MSDIAATAGEYLAAPTSVISAASGIDYAYRTVGEGTPALVLLQHFRGNLDNWADRRARRRARSRRWREFARDVGAFLTAPTTP